jgi:hypothetical protein
VKRGAFTSIPDDAMECVKLRLVNQHGVEVAVEYRMLSPVEGTVVPRAGVLECVLVTT